VVLEKFRPYQFAVVVRDRWPLVMGEVVIVRYSYRQQYHMGPHDTYSVLTMKNGQVTNTLSWVREDDLAPHGAYDPVVGICLFEAYIAKGVR